MRLRVVTALLSLGWAAATAQEQPSETSRWLAAAGVDARSSASSAVHLGAERVLASRLSMRLGGDYLTLGRPSDTSGTFTNVVGASVLASYTASAKGTRPYLVGGIGIQRAWSTFRLSAPSTPVSPVSCPALIPSICPPRDPIGNESGVGPTPVPIPIPVPGPSEIAAAPGTSTATFTYPTLIAGMGSSVRLGRVTGFTELRVAYIVAGQQRGQYFVPATLGIRF